MNRCDKIKFVCDEFECTGAATFKSTVDVEDALDVGGDISTDGSVSDVMGDLTNFLTSNYGTRV